MGNLAAAKDCGNFRRWVKCYIGRTHTKASRPLRKTSGLYGRIARPSVREEATAADNFCLKP